MATRNDRTDYPEEFIAHALSVLRVNGGNAKNTAKQLGVPRTTLRQWAGRAKSDTAVPKRVSPDVQSTADETSAQRLDAVFLMVTDPALVESKLEKAGLRDLLIAGDIATRGRALLRGQPTARTESVRVSLIEPDALRSDKLKVIEGGRK